MENVELLPSAARAGAGVGTVKNNARYSNSVLILAVSAIDPAAKISVWLEQGNVAGEMADTAEILDVDATDVAATPAFIASCTEPLMEKIAARWAVVGGNATFKVYVVYLPSRA
jgi:hypothetical protein